MIRVTGKPPAAYGHQLAWHALRRLLAVPAVVSLMTLFPPALAQDGEAAIVKRATELRAEPGESARSLSPLAAQEAVTRLGERRGPWVRVRQASGTAGWVHMFELAPASGSASGSPGAADALRGVANLFNRPSTHTVSTSAIGVRGLGAEDLARAQPDTAAVKKMEALRQSEAQARQFASGAALTSTAVGPLPAPPRPTPAPTGGPQEAQ